MKRAALRSFLFAWVLLAVASSAEAQQPKKVPRIGFLSSSSPSVFPARIEAFRQGLSELGYVEDNHEGSIKCLRSSFLKSKSWTRMQRPSIAN